MKRLSPGVRFLLGFVTFLLCVALFVTVIAGILVSNVVQILSSQENLESLLRQVLFADMHQSAPLRSAPLGNAPAIRQTPVKTLAPADIRLSEQQTATSMVEWIYEALAEDFGDQLQVDLDTVKEFVERSTLDDFLVEKGAGLINDVYTGENTVTLSADEIKAKIEENAALIEEYFGVPVDTQVITDVTNIIEENEYVERIEEEGIVNIIMNPQGTTTPDGMENPDSADTEQIQQIIDTTRTVLSLTTVLICVGACLLLIALILLVNMKQIWVGLNKAGITLMLAALPAMAVTVAVWVVPAGWAVQLGFPAIIESVLHEIVSINAVICFGVFAFGLLMLVGGIVTYCLVRSKRKQATEAAAVEEALIAEAPLAEVEFPAEEEASEEEIAEEETDVAEDESDDEDTDEDESEEEVEEETETV